MPNLATPLRCFRHAPSRLGSSAVFALAFVFLALSALTASPGLAHGSAADPDDDGAVVRVATTRPADLTLLRSQVDFWGLDRSADEAVIWATSEQQEALRAAGFELRIDVEATELYRGQALRASTPPAFGEATKGAGIPGFPCYRTVGETYADLAQLAADNPQLASWIDIGDSWEKLNGPGAGFDVHALVLTNSAIAGPKPPLLIIAAMHAREYTTAETATRFAEDLVAKYGVDPDVTWILDHHEIHIIPQLNPDGRTRAEAGASWRKNVNDDFCSGSSFRGVDLNRNSSFLWNGGSGSSGNPCSEVFRGPSAGSEQETQAIENYMALVFDDQRGDDITDPAPPTTEGIFISIHSFSELVLYPWEATATDSPNNTEIETLGRKFGFYNDYAVCLECLGTADGTTPDQAYGEYGVAAYTFELGTTFFQSCSAFENNVLPDNLPALHYAAKAARQPYLGPAGPEVIDVMVDQTGVAAGTPVTLTANADDTRFDSNGFGNEPTQNVVAAYYSIDTPPWLIPSGPAMDASDGAFDSTAEGVTTVLDTSTLSGGRHLVYVWAEDADGNRGLPTAVFLEIADAPLFVDGFESGDVSAWSSSDP